MKKLIPLLVAVLLISCADNTTTTTKQPYELKQRIVGKEYTVYKGVGYQIIEIDSIEYISSTYGGVYPITKK